MLLKFAVFATVMAAYVAVIAANPRPWPGTLCVANYLLQTDIRC